MSSGNRTYTESTQATPKVTTEDECDGFLGISSGVIVALIVLYILFN